MKWRHALLALALVGVLAGCAITERRPVDPGPDGIWGTTDDLWKSDLERGGDVARSVAEGFGFGWIGLLIQGASILATSVAAARHK